jgi:2-methylisocitrate lyase-like PEP mutase family enzyme
MKMSQLTQADKAVRFREMHDRKRILVLPNAWDVASARVFEEVGFAAIGTTSAGIAAVLGYPDGEQVSRYEMVHMVHRIARKVAVPVSADIETGYGQRLDDVAETVRAVIHAGAVGSNLEDGDNKGNLLSIPVQVERIQSARAAADAMSIALVINARTDVYLLGIGREGERFDHAVGRANAYRKAGADCLFVPGVRDAATIAALVRAIDGPVNILVGPGAPSILELEKLGVARASVGSGAMRGALTFARHIAQELRDSGTYNLFTKDTMTYAEVNELMSRGQSGDSP